MRQCVDIYILFCLAVTAVQVLYLGLVGSFPFNAFLAGTLCSLGMAVLAIGLRAQIVPGRTEFRDKPLEVAAGEFIASGLLLHFLAVNYVG